MGLFLPLFPILLGVIIGVMFGWEIGFGVALFGLGAQLLIVGQIVWGSILLFFSFLCAARIFLLAHGVIGVTMKASEIKVEYFDWDKRGGVGRPSEYQFSGNIEVKTPSEVAIKDFYLELSIGEKRVRTSLMQNADCFGEMGYMLRPSEPIIKAVIFQLPINKEAISQSTSTCIWLKTTKWERSQSVKLKLR